MLVSGCCGVAATTPEDTAWLRRR